MIKRIALAAIAAAACIMPAAAEIQPGTGRLLETLENSGILITLNHEECFNGTYNGQYRWLGFQREIRLCPGDTIDAKDHNTVRHEVVHAIQHCVNVARGTSTDTAVINDPDQLMVWAREHLTRREIQWIQDTYPRDQWMTEIEAFAGANAYTSAELEEMFLEVCTLQETDTEA